MKKTLTFVLIACLALSLAACGGAASSSQAASVPASEAAPASVAVSSTPASTADAADLDASLAYMVDAAELGNTISVSEIDLKAGGVNVDNVDSFVGAQSQLAAQNGGIVIIVKAVSGAGADIAADMESFRQASLGNADYEEFEDARNNTEAGIIKTYGDYVVYAVSATGNTDNLTVAADALFA